MTSYSPQNSWPTLNALRMSPQAAPRDSSEVGGTHHRTRDDTKVSSPISAWNRQGLDDWLNQMDLYFSSPMGKKTIFASTYLREEPALDETDASEVPRQARTPTVLLPALSSSKLLRCIFSISNEDKGCTPCPSITINTLQHPIMPPSSRSMPRSPIRMTLLL